MRLIEEFQGFLLQEVDLDKTRINTLVERVQTIQAFLSRCGWEAQIQRFCPQGSWAHKTIIKPSGDQGFDADLMAFVSPVQGWAASDYIVTLREAFRESGIYRDKAALHTRCVRLEYAGDFEIDIVPCVVRRPGGSYHYEVCNRADDLFEATDGEAYTAWLDQRGAWIGANHLREVVRLLKYLRDIKTTFSCKSILLTTLLGAQITSADALRQRQEFVDLPTTLKTLLGRLDAYIQARPQLHDVRNPVLLTESFNRHWDQDKYANFREMIHKYRQWVDDAYAEPNAAKSLVKWRKVFGDAFGNVGGRRVNVEGASATPPLALAGPLGDAVALVRQAGRGILARVTANLPWVSAPPWSSVQQGRVTVDVRASVCEGRFKPGARPFDSGTILAGHQHVAFEAFLPNNVPVSANRAFQVQWQVVNTDHAAFEAGQLRGGFYPSDRPGRRWEYVQYRGIHWVQAFLIRTRDGKCVGESSRFFIVVE